AQVVAVAALHQGLRQFQQLSRIDEPHAPRDFFGTSDLLTLAGLQDADELRSFDERVERARVEPGVAAAQREDLESSALEVCLIHARDLELAAAGWLHGFGNFDHVLVVEIEACDGPI